MNPNKITYYICINGSDCTTYSNKKQIHHTDNLKLSPNDFVTIKGRTITLSDLTERLLKMDPRDIEFAFDERDQIDLGKQLFAQVFGENKKLPFEYNRIEIITKDEHIWRLPWALLTNENGVFLSILNASVMISHQIHCSCSYELPPSPKIMIVMPKPIHEPETRADNHLEKIITLLSSADARYTKEPYIIVVSSWEEFQQKLKTHSPHIIYYYGHAIGDKNSSRLVFCEEKTQKRLDVTIIEFAERLRNYPEKPPVLAYINCCYGDSSGLLGVGNQLIDFIPAVITNRTVALIDDAQTQGLTFWKCLLLDGLAPHEAMNQLYKKLSVKDPRWMTPILYCNYENWKSYPPEPVSRLIHDPHWREKLDRIKQFSEVNYMTYEMLENQRPKILCYLWFGADGQGIDIFHKRLLVELREKLKNAEMYEVLPRWPPHFLDVHESFENMIKETFGVQSLDFIPGRIREYSHGKPTLVYIRHEPLRSTKLMNFDRLKIYIKWLDTTLVPLLEKEKFYALVGISYVVSNPSGFYQEIEKREIQTAHYKNTAFRVLDEMKKLEKKDLYDFVRTHNIRLPSDIQEKVFDEILDKTDGHYEKTLYELMNIVSRAWRLELEEIETKKSCSENDTNFGVDD